MTSHATTVRRMRSTRTWAAAAIAAVLIATGASATLIGGGDTAPAPSERHYAEAMAALDDAQIRAAFGTERPVARTPATGDLPSLAPDDRRFVRGIAALSDAQLRAAYGTARP